jgi:hypothetical protein
MALANTTLDAILLAEIIAIGAEMLRITPAHILGSTQFHSQ